MKAKTKFLEIYNQMPEKMRMEVICDYWGSPKSMNVVAEEVKYGTKVGKKILKDLGFSEKGGKSSNMKCKNCDEDFKELYEFCSDGFCFDCLFLYVNGDQELRSLAIESWIKINHNLR